MQFNPHQHTQFAAVSDNGCVQLWDLRKTEKPEKQFTAHSGPVFTCDWHPENRNILATAGRDKTIKGLNVFIIFGTLFKWMMLHIWNIFVEYVHIFTQRRGEEGHCP